MDIGIVRLVRTYGNSRKVSHQKQTVERFATVEEALAALALPMPNGCYRAAVSQTAENHNGLYWETIKKRTAR